jgi:hypothetical protein
MGEMLHTVRSSAIAKLGYDESTRTLYVVFKRGEAFVYREVPPATYIALRDSRSIGSWFIRNVRNAFAAKKIGDESALMALIENSEALKESLELAEREAERRSQEMQQKLARMIRREGRAHLSF